MTPQENMKIEHGIPIPTPFKPSKYRGLAKQMKVNDSVFFTVKTAALRFSNVLREVGFEPALRFVEEENGYRVWRRA